jgi:hypothetical protein
LVQITAYNDMHEGLMQVVFDQSMLRCGRQTNDGNGHFPDIGLCSARGRNAPDTGRA